MEHARAVIIGGGVGGTSVAYHLAGRGWRDVILLDRAELTSGSTFHSAGLVGQLRSSVTLTRMMVDGVALYRRLAAETGIDPGWREVGSLRLASSDERMEELRRQAGWASAFGLTLELVGPDEAHDRFPLMSTEGVRGAAWLPTDGWLDPSGLALSLAAGARAGGVDIRQHHRVVAIERAGGRVTGLTVEHAGERYTIATELVVNAGGMFAAEIGRLAGVTVPIIPMAHQYLFSDALEGVHADLPQLRDPDNLVYFREDLGGLLFGGYERHPAPWGLDGIPADFNGRLLAPDTARLDEIMEGAVRRVPSLAQAGVRRVVNGPEAFTPDNEFILGESEVPGFWVAAGLLRARHRRGRGRRPPGRELDRRWGARARRLAHGHPPVRGRLPVAALHARADDRGLRDLLRHPLPQRGAPGRATAPDVARVRRAGRTRRGVRREVGVGAAELVRTERGRPALRWPGGVGGAAAAWLGRPSLVAGDRGRGARDADGRRALRRVVLRQARGRRARSAGVPPARQRQRCRPAGRIGRRTPSCWTAGVGSRPT